VTTAKPARPVGCDDAKSPNTHENPAPPPAPPVAQPAAPPPKTIVDLAKQRPGDDLLAVLCRGAEQGNEWCTRVADRVLERGGAITEKERKVLRQMRDEGARASPGTRTSARQPLGNFRRKGA
jgi:hypothetical protein